VQFDAFDFVLRLGGQIAFTAVWATDNGNVLNDEQISPLP
jgi:hypothetical protein